jgi:hypothetical protein
MKKSNDTIGNRIRDIPACSAVPQPTASPRALHQLYNLSLKSSYRGLKNLQFGQVLCGCVLNAGHPLLLTGVEWRQTWSLFKIICITQLKYNYKLLRHPQHIQTGSNSSTIAADSSNGVTNTRCCRYRCMRS